MVFFFLYRFWFSMKKFTGLKKNSDFQRVYRESKSIVNHQLVLYVRENGLDHSRLGISVSKKVGNSVVRHKIKRLIKESVRLNEDSFHDGYDLVVVARAAAKGLDYHMMERSVLNLAHRKNLLRENVNS